MQSESERVTQECGCSGWVDEGSSGAWEDGVGTGGILVEVRREKKERAENVRGDKRGGEGEVGWRVGEGRRAEGTRMLSRRKGCSWRV